MACGNNLVSRSMLHSAPAPLTGPSGPAAFTSQPTPEQIAVTQQQTRRAMEQAERQASAATNASAAATAVKDAQRALDEARRMQAPAAQRATLIRELERRLEAVKRTADRVSSADQAEQGRRTDASKTDRLGRTNLGVPPSRPAPDVLQVSKAVTNPIDYAQLPGSASGIDDRQLGPALEDAWAQSYHAATPGERDVVAFTVGNFTWVWDATASGSGPAENRLIGVYGRSDRNGLPRDEGRIKGFPSPQRDHEMKVHRGHAAGHQLGGPDEGWNLFPQAAKVNQGGRWRELETYCAENPGTFMFVRAVYTTDTDVPSALEYGIEGQDGRLAVEQFDNL